MRAEAAVVERLLAAHRVEDLERAAQVRLRFSSGGLAFRSKLQGTALRHAEAALVPVRQEITVRGTHPRPWQVVVPGSEDLRRRLAALHTGTRLLRWSPEEVGVFAAAALWTYLTLPLLVRDAPDVRAGGRCRCGDRLLVRLDDAVAGHAPQHVLHVDRAGLVVRHDYTATAFGRWAHAAQVVGGYERAGAVPVGTARRVTPRLGRWRLPGPTLVWIELHEVLLDEDE